MMTKTVLAAMILGAACVVPVTALTIVQNTFDSGAEGWRVTPEGEPLAWHPNGGNGGGYVQGTDNQTGQAWYFIAPAAYRGDQSAAYGGTFSFDMFAVLDGDGSAFPTTDVVLFGAGHSLHYSFDYTPGTSWTYFSVALDETAGWTIDYDPTWNPAPPHNDPVPVTPASGTEILNVLGNVDGFYVRGEYYHGADRAGLDNPTLSSVPDAGMSVLLLGLALAPLSFFRRTRG